VGVLDLFWAHIASNKKLEGGEGENELKRNSRIVRNKEICVFAIKSRQNPSRTRGESNFFSLLKKGECGVLTPIPSPNSTRGGGKLQEVVRLKRNLKNKVAGLGERQEVKKGGGLKPN